MNGGFCRNPSTPKYTTRWSSSSWPTFRRCRSWPATIWATSPTTTRSAWPTTCCSTWLCTWSRRTRTRWSTTAGTCRRRTRSRVGRMGCRHWCAPCGWPPRPLRPRMTTTPVRPHSSSTSSRSWPSSWRRSTRAPFRTHPDVPCATYSDSTAPTRYSASSTKCSMLSTAGHNDRN